VAAGLLAGQWSHDPSRIPESWGDEEDGRTEAD
jgi:hypothetical protein